jgi:hypothetical protein
MPATQTSAPHSLVVEALRSACHPSRFPGMSGKMAAMLAYLIGAGDTWSSPSILELHSTSDGFLISMTSAYIDGFEGSVDDLRANIERLHEATQGSSLPMSRPGRRYLFARIVGLQA